MILKKLIILSLLLLCYQLSYSQYKSANIDQHGKYNTQTITINHIDSFTLNKYYYGDTITERNNIYVADFEEKGIKYLLAYPKEGGWKRIFVYYLDTFNSKKAPLLTLTNVYGANTIYLSNNTLRIFTVNASGIEFERNGDDICNKRHPIKIPIFYKNGIFAFGDLTPDGEKIFIYDRGKINYYLDYLHK